MHHSTNGKSLENTSTVPLKEGFMKRYGGFRLKNIQYQIVPISSSPLSSLYNKDCGKQIANNFDTLFSRCSFA